jgi:hypothetical protein
MTRAPGLLSQSDMILSSTGSLPKQDVTLVQCDLRLQSMALENVWCPEVIMMPFTATRGNNRLDELRLDLDVFELEVFVTVEDC